MSSAWFGSRRVDCVQFQAHTAQHGVVLTPSLCWPPNTACGRPLRAQGWGSRICVHKKRLEYTLPRAGAPDLGPGDRLLGIELGLKADILQVGLDHLRDRLADGVAGADHHGEGELLAILLAGTVGAHYPAGRVEQLLGPLDIVGILRHLGVVVRAVRRDDRIGQLGGAFHHAIGDRLPVDRIGHRLAQVTMSLPSRACLGNTASNKPL
jgi:hypothetical protein